MASKRKKRSTAATREVAFARAAVMTAVEQLELAQLTILKLAAAHENYDRRRGVLATLDEIDEAYDKVDVARNSLSDLEDESWLGEVSDG